MKKLGGALVVLTIMGMMGYVGLTFGVALHNLAWGKVKVECSK